MTWELFDGKAVELSRHRRIDGKAIDKISKQALTEVLVQFQSTKYRNLATFFDENSLLCATVMEMMETVMPADGNYKGSESTFAQADPHFVSVPSWYH